MTMRVTSSMGKQVNMVLNIHRTIRLTGDGEKGEGGRGYGGGGKREFIYLSLQLVTTRMTRALRWAATRAILMFHQF